MISLLGLLQTELRGIVADLGLAAAQWRQSDSAAEGRARFNRRAQGLASALSVLGRDSYTRLAQALISISDGEGAAPAAASLNPALGLVEELCDVDAEAGEAWLSAHADLAHAAAEALSMAAPPAAAAVEARSAPGEAQLRALYRVEIEEQCAAMGRLILQLEQSPDRLDLIPAIMRAAHSVKGASRAVRLDPSVQLAHALEDRLSAVQRGEEAIGDALIEFGLAVIDLLRELAQQGAQPRLLSDAERLLAARGDEGDLRSAVAPVGQPVPEYIAVEQSDPVLRIKASLVSRLIALASSSLVSGHRLRPFQERQQRLRQRLAMLSRTLDELHHRLGAPAQTTAVGGPLAEMRRKLSETRQDFNDWIDQFSEYGREAFDLNQRLYQAAALTRLRPFRDLALGYPRMVRDLARELGKRARLTIVGEGLEVDRDVLEQLDAPITHLLRNALDHGIERPEVRRRADKAEEGHLRIWVGIRAGMLAIDISDDGAGLDLEAIRTRLKASSGQPAEAIDALSEQALKETIFQPGFSTRGAVTEVSGRGVGLDVVRNVIERLEGTVRLSTRSGQGSTFHLLVPVSRAVTRSLAVRVGGETYAFPSLRIERVLRCVAQQVQAREGLFYLPWEGRNIGLLPLAELLDLGHTPWRPEMDLDVVLVAYQGREIGFVVESLLGEFDLATRPLDRRLGRVADVASMAVLPDGEPVILLDVDDLMRSALSQERLRLQRIEASSETVAAQTLRVLIADDSISVRELERQLLAAQGYAVEVAVDGLDAWGKLRDQSFDLLVTDVDMPRMNGIELTRSVKQDPRLRALPVVIVSYRDRPEDKRRGLDARADAYLTKNDFQDEGFVRLVQQLIGPSRARP